MFFPAAANRWSGFPLTNYSVDQVGPQFFRDGQVVRFVFGWSQPAIFVSPRAWPSISVLTEDVAPVCSGVDSVGRIKPSSALSSLNSRLSSLTS